MGFAMTQLEQTLTKQVEALKEKVVLLSQSVETLTEEKTHFRALYLDMIELNKKLERGLLGRKAERLPENDRQLTMQILETLLSELGESSDSEADPEPKKQHIGAHTRNKPTGRKPFPENLPRVEFEVTPPEVLAQGTDAFDKIGEETSEVIERRPASWVVVVVKKLAYKAKAPNENGTHAIVCGHTPSLPIEKGMAGPGLLADTLVKRWQDHLPLHRQQSIFAREGILLSKSTMCGWHEKLHHLCRPVVDAMWHDAMASPYLCTDATGVLVMKKEQCKWSHFFVLVAPEKHVLFQYTKRHDKKAVDKILSGYQGYLVCDAHSVYDHLYIGGDILEVACWAHCRRYFFKALSSDPERARQALSWISALFRLERKTNGKDSREKRRHRQEKSKRLVEQFFAWCKAEGPQVIKDTPIYKAIQYAQNQRQALSRFLDDGRLPIHNNISELQLRRQVIGRKNWIFCGSDDGAEVNTTFVSLLASCQMHGIEPWSYLRDLFCLLPNWPATRALELAPAYWTETVQTPEARQVLEHHVFRAISMIEDSKIFDGKSVGGVKIAVR